jgi:hypothetical protein
MGRPLKKIALPAIPKQPRSTIAQVLKFALQDIDAILRWPDRKEHYRPHLNEIGDVKAEMEKLQARLVKEAGEFTPETESTDDDE